MTKKNIGKPVDYRRTIDWILIIVPLIVFFFIPHSYGGDGGVRYTALDTLLSKGAIIPSKYSMIGPIFATPLYFLGNLFHLPAKFCFRYNNVLFVLGIIYMYRLLKDHLAPQTLRLFLLILVYGSMIPEHTTMFYGEVFTALMVTCGLLTVNLRSEKIGWVMVVIGVANTPATIVPLALVLLYVIFDKKSMRYGLILFAAAALVFAESWVRRGSPLASGYEVDIGPKNILPYSGLPGFSYPFILGFVSILFAFGKGLLWFIPGITLFPKRESLRKIHFTYISLFIFVIGLVLVYSKWWAWSGSWFYGPRFLLIASIPAALAMALFLSKQDKRLWLNIIVLLIF